MWADCRLNTVIVATVNSLDRPVSRPLRRIHRIKKGGCRNTAATISENGQKRRLRSVEVSTVDETVTVVIKTVVASLAMFITSRWCSGLAVRIGKIDQAVVVIVNAVVARGLVE